MQLYQKITASLTKIYISHLPKKMPFPLASLKNSKLFNSYRGSWRSTLRFSINSQNNYQGKALIIMGCFYNYIEKGNHLSTEKRKICINNNNCVCLHMWERKQGYMICK